MARWPNVSLEVQRYKFSPQNPHLKKEEEEENGLGGLVFVIPSAGGEILPGHPGLLGRFWAPLTCFLRTRGQYLRKNT